LRLIFADICPILSGSTEMEAQNMDRIITMVINRIIRRVVNRGVDAGIDRVSRRGQGQDRENAMTPEQREKVQNSQQNTRQAMRMMRRASRFTRF
jgi:hypothetical protein